MEPIISVFYACPYCGGQAELENDDPAMFAASRLLEAGLSTEESPVFLSADS